MRKIILLLVVSVLFIQCKKENNYMLAKGQVGKITSKTQVYELKSIFEKDSLVSRLGEGDFADSAHDEYLIYTKQKEHIFTIIPKEQHDSTATIESIQIFDKKYKTSSGLGLSSKFQDIIGSYSVNKVESTFTSVVLFVDEIDATITIDKKELGINDFGIQKINLAQIPDLAKIKTLTMWFD
ncbi:hypothetical protein [Psychroserpens sp.]